MKKFASKVGIGVPLALFVIGSACARSYAPPKRFPAGPPATLRLEVGHDSVGDSLTFAFSTVPPNAPGRSFDRTRKVLTSRREDIIEWRVTFPGLQEFEIYLAKSGSAPTVENSVRANAGQPARATIRFSAQGGKEYPYTISLRTADQVIVFDPKIQVEP